MQKTFTLNGKSLAVRTNDNGEMIQIAVFDGSQRIYALEVARETLADMQTEVATAGTTIESLVDFVIADFERLVSEKLLTV